MYQIYIDYAEKNKISKQMFFLSHPLLKFPKEHEACPVKCYFVYALPNFMPIKPISHKYDAFPFITTHLYNLRELCMSMTKPIHLANLNDLNTNYTDGSQSGIRAPQYNNFLNDGGGPFNITLHCFLHY